jgi:hypothetical protein
MEIKHLHEQANLKQYKHIPGENLQIAQVFKTSYSTHNIPFDKVS